MFTPYTHTVYTATGNIGVGVDRQGHVLLDGKRLDQRDAVNLAAALTQAVEDSIWRDQIGTAHYHDSAQILMRAESPLGQAITALRKVYSL